MIGVVDNLKIIGRAVKKFGLSGVKLSIYYYRWICTKKTDISKQPFRVNNKKYKMSFWVRPMSTDIILTLILFGVIGEGEYEYSGMPDNVDYIIDGGANIGLFSLLYSAKYPNAKIISIEPDDDNFAMLRKNTEGNANIHCVKAGIWNKDTWLEVIQHNTDTEGINSLATTVRETQNENSAIKAMSIRSIMNTFDFSRVDILKLDIEGSEYEVFSNDYEWLKNTGIVIMEIHDFIKQNCSQVVAKAMEEMDFAMMGINGEDIMYKNRKEV